MSTLVQQAGEQPEQTLAHRRGVLGLLLHPVAMGTLLGAAAAVLLGTWFGGQAATELHEDRWNRVAIIELMALSDAVAGIEAQDSENAPEQVAALLDRAVDDTGGVYRVLRLSGAQLLASTSAADAGDKGLPRRLSRDEKWFFDLAQGLRSAVQTNQEEGVTRRRQIEIEPIGEQLVRVSVPYFLDDRVAGVVQAERERSLAVDGPTWVGALPYILIPWALVVGILALRKSAAAAVWDPDHKAWGLFAIAAVILTLAVLGFARQQLGMAAGMQLESAERLAVTLDDVRDRVGTAAGEFGVTVDPGRENRWDVDLYQRPMGVVGDSGVIEAALGARMDTLRDSLGKSLFGNWLIGIIILGFSALGFGLRLRRTFREHRYAYLYVLPAMGGMLILVFFPFAYGIALSFTEQTVLNVSEPITDLWVGLQNYITILGDFRIFESTADGGRDVNYKNFYWTLFITICWTVSNVLAGVTIGMLLALALNTKGLRFTNLYRVLLILPWAIPNYITALIWKGMFHPQFGVINQGIQMFGGEPVNWFDGVFSSFMTGLITNGWLSFPFMMVVILGGLQSISQDMYEAARVEGATRWQQFTQITLPSLKPTIIPAVIISVVWTFNMFNVIYLVSGGEPAGANEILVTKAYKIAFEEYRYGYAAAYSVVIFMILLVYGVFQTKVTKATEATTA